MSVTSVLKQVEQLWKAIAVLVAVFLAGVVFSGFIGVPSRVAQLEASVTENRNDINRFLDRFDRYLCLQEVEQGQRTALECSR